MWPESHIAAAATDGWLLAYTVEGGQLIGTAYLEIYTHGPRFADRFKAVKHVIDSARAGSKLHMHAMSALMASRQKK